MPRLSVIVPHRRDEQLEATLLSVLENRPADCEIIVVHDGSYPNPYQLDDEIVFVDVEPGASLIRMWNAGIMAACSPVVNTLQEGVIVGPDWCEQAVCWMETRPELASVAITIERGHQGETYGLARSVWNDIPRLRSGRLQQTEVSDICGSAELACGVFRRSVLLALEGLRFEEPGAAAIDLAFAFEQLEMRSVCDCNSAVQDENAARVDPSSIREIAEMAVKHGVAQGGWLASLRELPQACASGPRSGWAWCLGLARGRKAVRDQRLERAKRTLADRRDRERLLVFSAAASRQAA
ncbi:MAG: glycosyltransferase [bacterium]|nr:glycosyltransferase [bacterium]